MTGLPPWLEHQAASLAAAQRGGRLGHALLLAGPAGIGKRSLARWLVQRLLCSAPEADGAACGTCADCHLLAGAGHPDLLRLEPEAQGRQIGVEAVRALCAELALSRHRATWKLAVIDPADAMTQAAANSLLKTLEEPTDNRLMILVAEHPERLPATVRSRCQALRQGLPSRADALAWLRTEGVAEEAATAALDAAGGAPLRAWTLLESEGLAERRQWLQALAEVARGETDPLALAADWGRTADPAPLQAWAAEIESRIGRQLVRGDEAGRLAARRLFRLLDRLWALLTWQGGGINRQLQLEALLLEWARLGTRDVRPGAGVPSTESR